MYFGGGGGGAGSNATLDAAAGAPPPRPSVGSNRSAAASPPWEHGPALRVDVLGVARATKDRLHVIMSYVDLMCLAGFVVFALGLGPFQRRLAAAVV